MLAAAPKEELGPKLVITWRLPDGGPAPRSVQQELYLYAEGGPLTYTAPDQPFMGGDRTTGGWFGTRSPSRPVGRPSGCHRGRAGGGGPTATHLRSTSGPGGLVARGPGHGDRRCGAAARSG